MAVLRALALALLLAWLFPAAAAEFTLRDGGTGVVATVIDGDTVVRDSGLEVRLVGIQAPKLALGRPGFEEQPLAYEARAALEDLVLAQIVRLSYGGLETDRYGRALAHLHTDTAWVQGEMLRRGLARVYSFADNRASVEEMLTLEREARDAGSGIWALPYYRVRSPGEAGDYLDRFEVVEGRVLAADEVAGRVYLNFGEDWRTHFTVSIAPRDARRFRADGFEPLDLAGARIRSARLVN